MESSTPSPEEEISRPKRNNTWIYFIIIVLLLGTNVYLFIQRKDAAKQNIIIKEQLHQTSTEKETLQQEYEASLARLDELTTQNARLNKDLQSGNSEIAKTKTRIQTILSKEHATQTELKEARGLIKSLNLKITNYEKQIALLKKENTELVVQRDSVATTNSQLQAKVNLAKLLHASNIRIKAINLRHGGRRERETIRAKRADLLRIIFDIDDNKLTDSGTKELKIRLVNPNGELLSNAALGSGSLTDHKGNIIYYSLSKKIDLETGVPAKDVDVDWSQSASYEIGAYTVEIYHEGYLIGKSSVSLR
jgi:hypothetical protein